LRIGAHRALDCRHEQSGRVVTERPPPSGAVAIGPTISPGILPFLPRSRPNARILPIYGTRPSLRGSSPQQPFLRSRRRHEPPLSHGSLPVRALARARAG
jgi:hypothetical protein